MGGAGKEWREDCSGLPESGYCFELKVGFPGTQLWALEQEASYRKGQGTEEKKKNSGRVCKACISGRTVKESLSPGRHREE